MTIAAVQAHTLQLLQGLPSPVYEPAVAQITPLPVGDAAVPQLFIWTTNYKEARVSMPRQNQTAAGSGMKLGTHTLRVSCLAIYQNDDPSNDIAFAGLLESVMAVMRADVMPVSITDNTTGQSSQLQNIGEKFDVLIDLVRSVDNQQIFRWYADIIATVTEAFYA